MKVIIHSLAFSLLFLASILNGEVREVLGKDQFNQIVLQSSKPVVVKFGAPWCPACVRSKAPFEKISDDPEFADATFVEMDFDKNPETTQTYGVQSLPTFLYFKNGKVGATKTGFSENLKNEVRATLAGLGDGEKKSEETAAQEEVRVPACVPGAEGGILQSINNFFSSLWNTITGWFK